MRPHPSATSADAKSLSESISTSRTTNNSGHNNNDGRNNNNRNVGFGGWYSNKNASLLASFFVLLSLTIAQIVWIHRDNDNDPTSGRSTRRQEYEGYYAGGGRMMTEDSVDNMMVSHLVADVVVPATGATTGYQQQQQQPGKEQYEEQRRHEQRRRQQQQEEEEAAQRRRIAGTTNKDGEAEIITTTTRQATNNDNNNNNNMMKMMMKMKNEPTQPKPPAPAQEQEQEQEQGDQNININKNNKPQTKGLRRTNLLWIVTDQQRWDTIRTVQNLLSQYEGKLKIRTPNLDRLARRGVLFDTAYCGSVSCTPSRAVLRTGKALQATGLFRNSMVNPRLFTRMPFIQEKIENLVSFEQILVDKMGYVAESYGKWHAPTRLFFSRKQKGKRVITNTIFDYEANRPMFLAKQTVKPWYRPTLNVLKKRDNIDCSSYSQGQQEHDWSQCPYTPVRMDPRYGAATHTTCSKENGFLQWQCSGENNAGVDSLASQYSPTGVITDMAFRALNRLAGRYKSTNIPFSLSIHYPGPHPPMLAPNEHAEYYLKNMNNIVVPESISDTMDPKDTAYSEANGRNRIGDPRYGWNDEAKVREVTAIYWGMIEEIDKYVGQILDRLVELRILANTMIVFTSDHGEHLGAHGMRNKFTFLEEAARIPLIIAQPGSIKENEIIHTPVSHIDLHATILDYLGGSQYDNSDGKSLRRYIEGTSFNQYYDERIIVSELDERVPKTSTSFDKPLGHIPNFMIRKGQYKLMLPKKRDSPVVDMMYNLDNDPWEMENLLGSNGMSASDEVIGKAEHLRALLLEWIWRVNGPKKYYSDPAYNLNVGAGDFQEIMNRRTWRSVDYWQSDSQILFEEPVFVNVRYISNEYVYIGGSVDGITLLSVAMVGPDANKFNVYTNKDSAPSNGSIRIKVEYSWTEKLYINALNAQLVIKTAAGKTSTVNIGFSK